MARQFYLAGTLASTPTLNTSLRRDVITGAVGAVVGLGLSFTGHPVPGGVVVLVAGGLILLFHKRDQFGAASADKAAGLLVRWVVAPFNRHQTGSKPHLLARVRLLRVARSETSGEMAMFMQRGRRRRDRALTTILRLEGQTIGVATDTQEDTWAARVGSVFKKLTEPGIGIEQADVITRIRPHRPEQSGDPETQELYDRVAATAQDYEHWLVLRMPGRALGDNLAAWAIEELCDVAWERTDQVARVARAAGMKPDQVVGPRRAAALLQSCFNPDLSVDDLPELQADDDPFTRLPSFTLSPDKTALVVDARTPDDPERMWWHTVATIPADGWPTTTVPGVWIEQLLRDLDAAPWRTIIVQNRLLAKHQAVKKARIATAVAMAQEITEERQTDVSTGEGADKADAGAWVVQDLRNQSAGDAIVMRILLSYPGETGLRVAREALATRLFDMGFEQVDWDEDGDQARAFMACLPLTLGVAEVDV